MVSVKLKLIILYLKSDRCALAAMMYTQLLSSNTHTLYIIFLLLSIRSEYCIFTQAISH